MVVFRIIADPHRCILRRPYFARDLTIPLATVHQLVDGGGTNIRRKSSILKKKEVAGRNSSNLIAEGIL